MTADGGAATAGRRWADVRVTARACLASLRLTHVADHALAERAVRAYARIVALLMGLVLVVLATVTVAGLVWLPFALWSGDRQQTADAVSFLLGVVGVPLLALLWWRLAVPLVSGLYLDGPDLVVIHQQRRRGGLTTEIIPRHRVSDVDVTVRRLYRVTLVLDDGRTVEVTGSMGPFLRRHPFLLSSPIPYGGRDREAAERILHTLRP